MPVTPCFDPTTGASGGAPPAASASLYDLTLTEVNLADGSWTLEDPDSLVDTVTYSADGNLVTWNTLAAGSANYRWDSGTTVRAPRWYKTLQIDGNNITNMMFLALMTRFEIDTGTADFHAKGVIGAALDATATDTGVLDLTAGYYQYNPGGNPTYGALTVNAATSSGSASNAYGTALLFRGGNGLGGVSYLNADNTDTLVNANVRNSGVVASGAAVPTTVQLVVGVGTGLNTTTITASDQIRFKARFLALTGNVET